MPVVGMNASSQILEALGLQNVKSATIAAAGTNLGTATPITTDAVAVTGSNGTKGVALPVGTPGKLIIVVNTVAGQTLPVYPQTGAAINAVGASSPITMSAVTSCIFYCQTATQWWTIPTVPS